MRTNVNHGQFIGNKKEPRPAEFFFIFNSCIYFMTLSLLSAYFTSEVTSLSTLPWVALEYGQTLLAFSTNCWNSSADSSVFSAKKQ